MKKMALSLAAFSVITAGLAGCGDADDNAAGPGNNTGVNQLGNNQNEQQDAGYAGWDRTERGDRGEGPITDMFTVDDRQGQGQGQGQGMQQGQGMGQQGTGAGQNQTMDRPGGTMNEKNNGENEEQHEIQETISEMDNVENSHVVVDDDYVLVGVRTSGNDGDETIDNIREELEDETDKEVYVSDDEEIYDDIRGVENDMAEGTGEALDETGETIEGIIEDLSDAAQRPFERSR
ncbi:YhcN/YlaJ family sporulation lipoprotein [Salicibibacter kimchii]|uniref:Sporulation protein n=1 Tax=Salicibibacter kimchii TaxID=2099786 RepID=A0A345C3G1_9BACI|nr:YhcN/YlaJ family sporulation lipoprotein [Salicibibacter kimchii]AXF57742.1 hypothetical protein DT065_18365 [Salicibibacter kimchii]